MTNDELLSKTISYLRFPLIIGVVYGHFNLAKGGLNLHGIKYGINHPDWYQWFMNVFCDVVPKTSVCLFFMISGFLFFYRKDFNSQVYLQKLRTRTRTILVPFLLWNLIAIPMTLVRKIPLLSPIFPNAYRIDVQLSLERIFNTFFDNYPNKGILLVLTEDTWNGTTIIPYPIDFPLWFLSILMVIILLSPAIWWFIKKCDRWFVVALGLIWFFFVPYFIPYGSWSIPLIIGTFFFSWGAWYSINKVSFVDALRKYKFVPYAYIPFAIADAVSKDAAYNLFIHDMAFIVGTISAVVVASGLLEKRRAKTNETLANSSFFVFALHALIIGEIGKALLSLSHLPDNTYAMLALYCVVPLLTLAVCVALYVLLRMYMPQLCHLLTGGR